MVLNHVSQINFHTYFHDAGTRFHGKHLVVRISNKPFWHPKIELVWCNALMFWNKTLLLLCVVSIQFKDHFVLIEWY